MPSIPTPDIVNAVVQSTTQYLQYLNEHGMGESRHLANHIVIRDGEDSFIGNAKWKTYSCSLPPHLTVRADSAATLLPNLAPGREIEVRLLEYDRRTGATLFATQSEIPGRSGNIIIDFRWIIRKCLYWYECHGSNLPRFDDCPAWRSITLDDNPAMTELSAAQQAAVRTMMTSGISYIWGPPGTGKTQYVLNSAVRQLTDHDKKVLILAPTNIAVDNVLVSLIKAGMDASKIFRVGIPSKQFIDNHPECCEQRAFQSEIRRIKSQIRMLTDQVKQLTKLQHAKATVERLDIDIQLAHKMRSEYQNKIQNADTERQRIEQVIDARQSRIIGIDLQIKADTERLETIAFPQMQANITSLESAHVDCIKSVRHFEDVLKSTGFLSRLFTKRVAILNRSILNEKKHLESVEQTLISLRDRRETLRPQVSMQETALRELSASREQIREDIVLQMQYRQKCVDNLRQFQSEQTNNENALTRIEDELRNSRDFLHSMAGNYPADSADELIAGWMSDIHQHEAELDQYTHNLQSKAVLGMTLDGFIGLTIEQSLEIDHVFIDEAPYAPIAKVLPVLSLKCPISLLGDHLQLPPVCANDNDATICAYWAKSSIYLEDAFELGDNWHQLCKRKEPVFSSMRRSILLESYRFGPTLARALDRHIYGMIGLTGVAATDTSIKCIHCEPYERQSRKKRQNHAEADLIMDFLERWWSWSESENPRSTLAILTPYKNQAQLLRCMLARRYGTSPLFDHVEVWNTHQAQGREWDWILFSVVDTGNLRGNSPFFTDSKNKAGRPLLNTTISRAKSQLRIFLDATYWRSREPESMLTDLTRQFLFAIPNEK